MNGSVEPPLFCLFGLQLVVRRFALRGSKLFVFVCGGRGPEETSETRNRSVLASDLLAVFADGDGCLHYLFFIVLVASELHNSKRKGASVFPFLLAHPYPRGMLQATLLHRAGSGTKRWAAAQANDPFVQEARRRGYIARSAFKLLQIDDRFHLLNKHSTKVAVDLGASPGGWCQVIAERASPMCHIYGVDLVDLRTSIPNAHVVKGDFSTAATQQDLMQALESRGVVGAVDVVTSDMCPNRSGGIEDKYRIAELSHSALQCAVAVLKPGGHVVLKVLGPGGGTFYDDVQRLALQWFTTVQFFKPAASRGSSDESFLVGLRRLSVRRSATSLGTSPRLGKSLGSAPVGGYGLDDWPGQQRTTASRSSHRN